MTGAADNGCDAVRMAVTGAGTVATPFTLTPVIDWTRLFSLDGDEPWTLADVGGCTKLVPRCQYSAV